MCKYINIYLYIHIYVCIYCYMYIYKYTLHHQGVMFSFLLFYAAAFRPMCKSLFSSAFQSNSSFPCVVEGHNRHTFISVYLSCVCARVQPLLIAETRCKHTLNFDVLAAFLADVGSLKPSLSRPCHIHICICMYIYMYIYTYIYRYVYIDRYTYQHFLVRFRHLLALAIGHDKE